MYSSKSIDTQKEGQKITQINKVIPGGNLEEIALTLDNIPHSKIQETSREKIQLRTIESEGDVTNEGLGVWQRKCQVCQQAVTMRSHPQQYLDFVKQ